MQEADHVRQILWWNCSPRDCMRLWPDPEMIILLNPSWSNLKTRLGETGAISDEWKWASSADIVRHCKRVNPAAVLQAQSELARVLLLWIQPHGCADEIQCVYNVWYECEYVWHSDILSNFHELSIHELSIVLKKQHIHVQHAAEGCSRSLAVSQCPCSLCGPEGGKCLGPGHVPFGKDLLWADPLLTDCLHQVVLCRPSPSTNVDYSDNVLLVSIRFWIICWQMLAVARLRIKIFASRC